MTKTWVEFMGTKHHLSDPDELDEYSTHDGVLNVEAYKLIFSQLADLAKAINDLDRVLTSPVLVHLPRIATREIILAESSGQRAVWPRRTDGTSLITRLSQVSFLVTNDNDRTGSVLNISHSSLSRSFVTAIRNPLTLALVGLCGNNARSVLRTVRRIETATFWCKQRTTGLLRHQIEIASQQKQITAALKAESLLIAMSGR